VLHDAAPGHRRLDLVTGMGHAYGTRGLEPISDAVAWCLAVPNPGPIPEREAIGSD